MFSQLRAGLSDLLRSTDLPYTLIDPAGKYLRRSYGGRESLGFGFELVPLIYAGAHADRCIENLLRFLPEGSTLQIGQLYSEASSHLVDAWEKAQTDHNNHPLLRESIAQRAAFFRDTIKHGSLTGNALAHLRLARTYAFLSLPIDRNIPIDPAAATAAEMARQHTDVVREYFRALGMHGEPLNASEQAHLIACMHALLAKGLPAVAPSEFADPAALLKLEPPSCSGKDRFITIGSVAAATFTVYNDPTLQPHWTPGMLLGTAAKHRPLPPHPFWLWTLFHKAPGDATGETIDTLTALTVFCPTKQVTRLRNEMASLWAPSGIEVEQPADQLRLYQAALPHGFNSGSRSSLRLLRKLPLAAACRLAPIASEWTGHPIEGGGPLFATRGGQPASIDLWRSETTYNAALVGGPGSGRNLWCIEFSNSTLSAGGTVRIICDYSNYRCYARMLGAEIIDLDPASPVSINPFWGIQARDVTHYGIPTCIELIRSMISPATAEAYPAGVSPELTRSTLLEAIGAVAQVAPGGQFGMLEIRDMLRTMGTPHARQIASALDLFADGALAPWFNGEPRVNADSPFVLFGTHKLADRLLAQGVKALLVKALMVRIAVDRYASFGSMERVPAGHYETRRRLFPMLVLLDDVRTLFIDQAPAQRDSLIESVLQIMRPALVSVVTVGIYCSDFLPGHTAAEFLEYSPFRIALLNSVDRGTARNHFFGETPANRFPAEFWHQVDSIQRPSTYSEAVVRHTSGAGLFRLIPDPFSLVLSSSNPLDQAQINDAERDGRSRLDAIRAIVAESYPSGYAATLLERVRARP